MADFYLKSGSATERANDTAYVLGNKVVIARADTTANYLVVRKWVLECTTAGTSGAAVPAWPSAVTQDTTTVTDGGVTWTCRKPGFSSGTTGNWTFSAIYMDYVATAMAAGDRLWVSNNHSESVAVSITYTFPGTAASPNQILCGTDTAAPPTTLDTTAICATGAGAYNITANGTFYCYGVQFRAGVGATVNAVINLSNSTGNFQTFDNCLFEIATTSASVNSYIAPSVGAASLGIWKNCSVKFGAAAQTMNVPAGGKFIWDAGAIAAGSAAITTMWNGNGLSRGGDILISGINLSVGAEGLNLASGAVAAIGKLIARNCKLPASWTGTAFVSIGAQGFNRVEMHNCDSADTNYRFIIADKTGSIVQETTLIKTSGASDGTTGISWKMVASANAEYPLLLLISPEFMLWNETTASAKTITVDILHDSLTNLKDDEVWLDVQYLGTSGFPLGSFINDAKANVLATAADQSVDGGTWTTTGMTNPNTQQLSVTFTPQEKGVFICCVMLAKASYTIYVDPLAVVT